MATRQIANSNLGKAPTTSQKLIYISKKLGLTGIAGMQGTTFNLFDTVILPTNAANRQTLSFFTDTANKSRNFTNFQNGQLNAGEAMVIEELSFYLVTLSATNLTLASTTINDRTPLSNVVSGQVSLFPALMQGIANITIANSKVVKDLLTFEQDPNYNSKTTGVSLGSVIDSTDTLTRVSNVVGQNKISLEAPPVLPPNQKFEVSLELPPVGTVTGNLAIVCVVGRFGSIYSAKTTL